MVRAPVIDQNGLKKGAWSFEEDNKLRAYVEIYGPRRWCRVPSLAGLRRCGKSCRLRWMNYLRPGVKRGNYTKDENDLICKMHEKYGNRWSAMAAKLPGRTDNEIKNHWHTHLRKRALKNNVKQRSERAALQGAKEKEKEKPKKMVGREESKSESELPNFCASDFGILESFSLSQETTLSSSDDRNISFGLNWVGEDCSFEDFWAEFEPLITDNEYQLGHRDDEVDDDDDDAIEISSLAAFPFPDVDFGITTCDDDYLKLFYSVL